jgi:hypothetical protein
MKVNGFGRLWRLFVGAATVRGVGELPLNSIQFLFPDRSMHDTGISGACGQKSIVSLDSIEYL